MPDFALCGMTISVRIQLAVQFFLPLPFKVHSPFKSLGTSILGYVCLVANPLPDTRFLSTSHFGLKRYVFTVVPGATHCSPDGYFQVTHFCVGNTRRSHGRFYPLGTFVLISCTHGTRTD